MSGAGNIGQIGTYSVGFLLLAALAAMCFLLNYNILIKPEKGAIREQTA